MWTLIVREGLLKDVGHYEDSDIDNNRPYKYVKQHEKMYKHYSCGQEQGPS